MAAFTTTAASPTPCRPTALVARSPVESGSSRWAPLRCKQPVVGLRRAAAPSRRGTTLQVQAKKQTFSSFDELLEKSEKPILVDFYATWREHCLLIS
ncbi:hypothetical protein E2562_028026 [Oryza meyeriana var. granulata]|uniref:Thioredoxin domain-containing protein n=1 Tax=Oryza meyeriana var. granulata TaxID=110450 RepID=A0A6G1C0B1_9ORYZ|nr:hypothetical protein E2562_028026 [Oryza meyeriana var. granulata]